MPCPYCGEPVNGEGSEGASWARRSPADRAGRMSRLAQIQDALAEAWDDSEESANRGSINQ